MYAFQPAVAVYGYYKVAEVFASTADELTELAHSARINLEETGAAMTEELSWGLAVIWRVMQVSYGRPCGITCLRSSDHTC